MSLVGLGKRVLPVSTKNLIERGVRDVGRATSHLRPPPDFLVIGTKRGGTTSLWQMLLAHPQVMPMVPAAKNLKSPQFLTSEWQRGPAWYAGHFPTRLARARHARLHGRVATGEASPAYLWDPRAAERGRSVAPQARVVILLRDPVARAWSHWQERTKEGTEVLSFEEALAVEDGRLAGEVARMRVDEGYSGRARDWYSYRSRGEYAEQVARWLEAYPPGHVLVRRSEDFYAAPGAVFAEVCTFLGLDEWIVPAQHRNVSYLPPAAMTEGTKAALETHFAPHNERLADLLGTEVWWTPERGMIDAES